MGKSGSGIVWDPVLRRYKIPGVNLEEEMAAPPPPPKIKKKVVVEEEEKKPVPTTTRTPASFIDLAAPDDDEYKPAFDLDGAFGAPPPKPMKHVDSDEE